ncbi:Protein of unknown function [Actinomadura meyerae]|jgi:hypothetical protein|uniref:DUF2589 domain-containing protein n=1 Tax=Actinomadura meyerae TaxID=240840 RepID=A0A239P5P7_9ACTN|nr:DUF2589 domain-containing protein [Actinomadura meyerae]SNT61984.1 Protein of unknown function [Actinomadura meyerae]
MTDPNRSTGDPVESGLAVLRVEALLGAAYAAVVRAQAQAALEAVAVIDRVGFATGADGSKTARVFEFAFHRHELDPEAITADSAHGSPARTSQVEVSVPLLSLITPPSLIIDEAEIDLALEVVGHDQPPHDTGTEDTSTPPAVIHARVAAGDDATLKVRSRLKQVPAGGTARIHQLLDTAVSDLGHLDQANQIAHYRDQAARLLQRLSALVGPLSSQRNPGPREWTAMDGLLEDISEALEFGAPGEVLRAQTEELDAELRRMGDEDDPLVQQFRAALDALRAVVERLAPFMTEDRPAQPE